jgi:hypothetical protein
MIMDININDGDLWIQVFLDGDEVDNGFSREDFPYEYILETEDDDGDWKEFLIIKVSFIDAEQKDGETVSEVLIEQFLDPGRSDSDFLILGRGMSVEEGEEETLKYGYVLVPSEVDTDTTTLILKKNGNILKQEDDMEEGDVFSYTLQGDGRINTIFMAYVESLFEGADSNAVVLRNVTLRKDIGLNADSSIDISLSDVSIGEKAIISYTLDEYASRVDIYLDGGLIDQRNNVDAGTYSAVTEKLEAGTYEIYIKAITEEGLEVEEDYAFEVGETENQTPEDSIGDIVDNITDVINVSGVEKGLKAIPGFGAMISVLVLVLTFMWKRR